jgi:hypothetical protein
MKSMMMYVYMALGIVGAFTLETIFFKEDLYLLISGGAFGLLLYIAVTISENQQK